MTHGRLSPFLRQRLLFLLAGNVALLVAIAVTMKQGGSFAQVLARCGPNVAPVVLAGVRVNLGADIFRLEFIQRNRTDDAQMVARGLQEHRHCSRHH